MTKIWTAIEGSTYNELKTFLDDVDCDTYEGDRPLMENEAYEYFKSIRDDEEEFESVAKEYFGI
jgi:hypothetical protein